MNETELHAEAHKVILQINRMQAHYQQLMERIVEEQKKPKPDEKDTPTKK